MTKAETKEKTPMLFQRLQVLGDLAVAGKLTNIMLHRVPQVKRMGRSETSMSQLKRRHQKWHFCDVFFVAGLSNAFERARMAWDNLYFPQFKRSDKRRSTKDMPKYSWELPNHINNIEVTTVKPLAFQIQRFSTFLGCQGASCALALCNWAAQLKKGDGLRSSLMRSHRVYWCCQLLHFRFPVSGEHPIFDVCNFASSKLKIVVSQANTPFSFGNLELEKWHRPQNNGRKRYGLRQQEQETYETWNNPEGREIDKPLKESFKKHLATCSCWTCKWEIPLSWQVWHVHECWLPGGYDKPLDIWQRSWRDSWTRSFANISMVDFTQIIFK